MKKNITEVNSIAWHERNLNNVILTCEKQLKEINDLNKKLDKSLIGARRLELQIETAKKEGKDKFDADKYLVNRK